MRHLTRLAGAALMAGGLLFILRMAPVMAVVPEDMQFPPPTPEDLARLAEIAGPAWPLAHALGLIAAVLIVAGYWGHGRALAQAGHPRVAQAAAMIATLAFGSFGAALMIDGFAVPAAPSEEVMAGRHDLALSFFGPGISAMFLAMALLSTRCLHGLIHSRWLGALGLGLAILALAAYLAGLTGPRWDRNIQISGSLMMLGFLWHVGIGAAALFGRGIKPGALSKPGP